MTTTMTVRKTLDLGAGTPPLQIEDLKAFEGDLTKMIERMQFRKVSDPFQSRLKADIKSFKGSEDIIVKADKTKNLYRMSQDKYRKLLRNNIAKNYQSAPETLYTEINTEAKKIAESLKLDDRMEILAKADAFITLKDH